MRAFPSRSRLPGNSGWRLDFRQPTAGATHDSAGESVRSHGAFIDLSNGVRRDRRTGYNAFGSLTRRVPTVKETRS